MVRHARNIGDKPRDEQLVPPPPEQPEDQPSPRPPDDVVAAESMSVCSPTSPTSTGVVHRVRERAAEVRAELKAGNYQMPRRPLRALINTALHEKRPLRARADAGQGVGTLSIIVRGGTFFTTKRPYLIAELDGHEERTSVGLCDAPHWGLALTFEVFDPSSDLRIFLLDDEASHNERPIGRVILPLAHFCDGAPLPRPSPARRLLVRFMPVTAQHGETLLARYSEATPRVPGSGMVRPKGGELGTLELDVCFRLRRAGAHTCASGPGHAYANDPLALLRAYALAPPPGRLTSVGHEAATDSSSASSAADARTAAAAAKNERSLQPKVRPSSCLLPPASYLLPPTSYPLVPISHLLPPCIHPLHRLLKPNALHLPRRV